MTDELPAAGPGSGCRQFNAVPLIGASRDIS